jgi:hypothetical protein|tara:strand:+ start:836 stop:1210 length:375 start_codon:yes stop_codon:yes gene_type:complete
MGWEDILKTFNAIDAMYDARNMGLASMITNRKGGRHRNNRAIMMPEELYHPKMTDSFGPNEEVLKYMFIITDDNGTVSVSFDGSSIVIEFKEDLDFLADSYMQFIEEERENFKRALREQYGDVV